MAQRSAHPDFDHLDIESACIVAVGVRIMTDVMIPVTALERAVGYRLPL
jgi:hypothetical protein